MEKAEVILSLRQAGLIAVIRATGADQARRLCEACLEGGITAVELTFTVPGAAALLGELSRRYDGTGALVGAGSVLDPETARLALLEGAQFIVCPALHLPTLTLCHRYRAVCLPGAMSVTEVVAGLEAGADLIKVFPGEVLGPAFVRAVRGPLPQALLVPTGGVNLANVPDWIAAGAAALAVGGALTAGAETGDWARVTRQARALGDAVRAARSGRSAL